MQNWFVYILKCADSSFYIGITTDIARRVDEHNHSGKHAAKYTRGRQPVNLVYSESYPTRSSASKREYALKRLRREEKLALIDEYSLTNT